MIWVLILILLGLLGTACFYLYRFATYIIVIEDDLSEAIEVFNRSNDVLDQMLKPNTFFTDSPEARKMLQDGLEDIKMCKLATQSVIEKFTRLSKKQYIRVIDTRKEEEEEYETWT